jgi:hypothetical protein
MIKKFTILAAVVVALGQNVQAVPITGSIGFAGTAVLNTPNATTASTVVGWINSHVETSSGDFALYTALNDAVFFYAPWNFNSGPLPNFFWTVKGFKFSLSASAIYSQGPIFLDVVLTGTVSGNGFDATAFEGTFQVANPPSNAGLAQFSERLSFNSIPDGGTTALLLGAALSGLALIKRKFVG